jgi:nucleoside-diphosphate-sugar epimerase
MADKLSHRIYNIAGDGPIKYREFTEVVKKLAPHTQVELQSGTGPRHRPNAYMNIDRIKKDVGYRPQYDLERGAAEYIDWLRVHSE